MKKVLMMIAVLMTVAMAVPYADTTDNGILLKSFSKKAGVGIVVIGLNDVLLISYVKPEYNRNGLIPMLVEGSTDEVLCELDFITKTDDGGYAYLVSKPRAIIQLLKSANTVDVMIMNHEYGDSDAMWSQNIPLNGFTKLYNSLY